MRRVQLVRGEGMRRVQLVREGGGGGGAQGVSARAASAGRGWAREPCRQGGPRGVSARRGGVGTTALPGVARGSTGVVATAWGERGGRNASGGRDETRPVST